MKEQYHNTSLVKGKRGILLHPIVKLIIQYLDTYSKELEKLLEAKSKGQEVVPKQGRTRRTTDIIEALKASLQAKTEPPRQRKSK